MLWRTAKTARVVLRAAALVLLTAHLARADEVDEAIQKLIHLDHGVHIMALEFNETPRDPSDLADRRVIDAQGLLGVQRPEEATTVLLDVVARWPHTRAAEDATFLLGDALFQLGDLLSARRFYEGAVLKFTGTKREQQALGRLIEIALRTGDFEHVDTYLGLLAKVQTSQLDPVVAYVKAKLLYYRGDLDGAARVFANIPPASPYSWQSRYFIGTMRVKAGDLDGAAAAYEDLLRTVAHDGTTQEIQDLARLALGRIYYQQEDMGRAIARYRSIPSSSKVYADGLYELGWSYVRSSDLDAAFQTFDQLVRVSPEGPQAPDAKLLLGSLRLHRGDLDGARISFARARDDLAPTYDKLRLLIVMSEADPRFLESLAAPRSFDEFNLDAFVPPSARKWVRNDPEVERLLTLANDFVRARRGLADLAKTLQRVETALAEPDRQTWFPDLTRARSLSTETLARVAAVRGQFASRTPRLQQAHLVETEVLPRSAAAVSQLRVFDARIDGEIDTRLLALKDLVSTQHREVAAANDKLAIVTDEAQDFSGSLAQVMTRVADRLYDLVVRADVGLIDVSWGFKARRTRALQAVLTKKNLEIEVLDDNMKRQEVALSRRLAPATDEIKRARREHLGLTDH